MLGPYRLLLLTVVLTVLVDQGTKALATVLLPPSEIVPVMGDVIDLRLRHNPGIGWGLGAQIPTATGRWLFPGLGMIVLAGLVEIYRRISRSSTTLRLGLALLLGGGIGNLIDRVHLGAVTDFIAVHFDELGVSMSGTFNMADGAMITGIALMAGVLTRRREVVAGSEEGGTS